MIEYGDVVKPVNESVGTPFSQPYLIVWLSAVKFEQQIIIETEAEHGSDSSTILAIISISVLALCTICLITLGRFVD